MFDKILDEIWRIFSKERCRNCGRMHQYYRHNNSILVNMGTAYQTCDHPECEAAVNKANEARMKQWQEMGCPGGSMPLGGVLPGTPPQWPSHV